MTTSNLTHEQRRNVITKWIVTDRKYNNSTRFMCVTNWAGGYTAGVMEFKSEVEALDTARDRTETPVLFGFNEFGERIL